LWQRIYFMAAVVLCATAFLLPNWLSRPKTWFMLLSDVGQTVVGKPAPENLPRWEARTPLAQPRSRAAAAVVGDQFLIIGGENAAGNTLALVDAYDLRFNQWNPLPALPHPLANAGAAVWKDEVFVAGGSANLPDAESQIQITNTLYALAPQGGLWRTVGPLPSPLAGAGLVADADALYLLGGWDGETMHDEIWRLDLNDTVTAPPAHWELIGRMPEPAAFFGAVMLDREIYIVGGYDGLQELAQATVFNPNTGQLRSIAPLSTPRSGIRLVYDDLGIVALGGGWTRPVDTHERYDAFTNQWSNFPSPIRGEWRHFAAAVKEGNIHIVGGWSGDYLDTHLLYQSTFRALLPVITND
jgi:N-acetylneuraminic acid mutarotase